MNKSLCKSLGIAVCLFISQTTSILASHDENEIVKSWSPPLGHGSFGSSGLDSEKIMTILKSASNPALTQGAFELVRGQDDANSNDIKKLARFIKGQPEEKRIQVDSIIEAMEKDIAFIEEANAKKIAITNDFPLYTSLKRLTTLDDGTSWYLPRAMRLLRQYPSFSQGDIPPTPLSNNDFPVWRTALYYSAYMQAESLEEFESLIHTLGGYYITQPPQDIAVLIKQTHLYLGEEFIIPTGFYVFGGNQTKRDLPYSTHLGDCSSQVSQVLSLLGKNSDYFGAHRTSTLYLEIAHDLMLEGAKLASGRTLTDGEATRLQSEAEKSEILNLKDVLFPVLDFGAIQAGDLLLHRKTSTNGPLEKQMSGPGHVAFIVDPHPQGDSGSVAITELNRMDNPDAEGFIEGYGYRNVLFDRPNHETYSWETRILRFR